MCIIPFLISTNNQNKNPTHKFQKNNLFSPAQINHYFFVRGILNELQTYGYKNDSLLIGRLLARKPLLINQQQYAYFAARSVKVNQDLVTFYQLIALYIYVKNRFCLLSVHRLSPGCVDKGHITRLIVQNHHQRPEPRSVFNLSSRHSFSLM